MYKTMAQAFINKGIAIGINRGYLFQDGWKASLSYRTFKKLDSEGYTKFNG